ncbi:MAG TPA: 50S ribosomal protein L32 [Candidatus Kapabacteria bacterium]|nr:50S ribosomal protein L32 [Candidatus Kapabacteria bacterium]
MPNPTHRNSRTRRDKRRTHYKAAKPSFGECKNCGAMKQLHRACPNCGYYNGRQMFEPKSAS